MMRYGEKKGMGMRKSDTVSLKDALSELLNTYRLNSRFTQTHLKSNWEEIAGKAVAKRTSDIFFKKEIMFIKVSSAPLKQEMNYAKPALLARIQERYGKDMVHEIIIL